MGRPPLSRRVSFIPPVTYFKPAGIPLSQLEEIELSIEEIESLRLKDLEDLEQEQCAEKMNISRTTFVRILDSARRKAAEALINGKAIRIEGGNYELASRRFRCLNNHEWDISDESLMSSGPQACPTCGTGDIRVIPPVSNTGCHRGQCRRGRRRTA
ncbi:MAG: DUF134 domain-containing protein [Dehalococcoidales bacterium]|nr:DUF134 domain-containing protein [Dehalococcoidales bacterium]